MNRVPPVVAAFTMIELMISIALGSLIIITAMAGFRAASQSVTSANRMSLENSLLRAGYWQAETDLDFWTNLDNPTLPDSQRPLKGIGAFTDWTSQGRQHGLPFTPMYAATNSLQSSGIWVKGGTVPMVTGPTDLNTILPRQAVMPTSALTTETFENDTGWDPTFAWAPHDPRTWSRANMAEKDLQSNSMPNLPGGNPANLPILVNGRYAIFGDTGPGADLQSYSILPDPNLTVNQSGSSQQLVQISYTGYPSGGIHPWYYRQLNSLINAMGYAAFCDYLPANAIYTWYTNQGDRTLGDINKFGISPNYNFCNWDGNQRSSRGIYRNTYATSYGYLNPRAPDDYRVQPAPNPMSPPPVPNNLRQWHYQYFQSDYGAFDTTAGGWSGVVDLQWFLSHANFPEKVMGQRPDNWPDVQTSVGRLIKNAHFVAVAKVRRTSPLTGEVIELSWCGLGSTLRGARQQRLRDGQGWARWDNRSGATNDPNLDTP